MAQSGRDDWYRSSSWDVVTAAEFEARLKRTRVDGRVQYIRIQATHLLDSQDPEVRQAGRVLLRRVIEADQVGTEAKAASEQLGVSLAQEGQLAEAEQALRETLRLCVASPIGASGTSGVVELRLAEVILAGGDQTRVDEVAQLLRSVEAAVQAQGIMRNVTYRFLLASARVADARKDPTAEQLASGALAVAAESTSLPREFLGRPNMSNEELVQLTRISKGR
uniref:hypothetical protein n=1 Tax=Paractinoplanes polyasparticus TaxID=2856853 RepID=UPI001C855156|nr:hypothetical protein [Actinoplanes polyasparticus]